MSATTTRRRRGFTLVEVLIALVLLSLLMLVLTSALRSMGQVEERVEQRIEAADDYRLATQLLGDVLGHVSARRHRVQAAGGPAQAPFFEARPDSLAWIGVMPARFGLGGRHYLRLALEPGEGGARLVLRHAPWTGAPTFAAWAQAEARVLAGPVEALQLRYQNPLSGRWDTGWPPAELSASAPRVDVVLPSAVEIQIQGPEPAWPPLILAVAATQMSEGGQFRATFSTRQ